jgi:Family of unknown function (DUF6084)
MTDHPGDLTFTVMDITPESYAVVPNLLARLRIEESSGEPVHAVALRCQVRIEPQRRRYNDAEEAGLLDLFGPRQRWGDTLKTFLWMHASTMVPGFTGSTEVTLPLACTYDFEVSGAKYLQALHDGEIPLVLMFNGTVFTRGSSGFAVTQIPWDKEADYRLPVTVWRDLMDRHFPGTQWLRMHRDTVEALAHYKAARGFTTWEATFDDLLAQAGQVTR